MSERSARAAERVLEKLLEAKGVSRDILGNIRRGQSDATRLLGVAGQLVRGDVTSLVTWLAGLGPYGLAAAISIGVGAIGYRIYQVVTEEKPTEVYMWRYPK